MVLEIPQMKDTTFADYVNSVWNLNDLSNFLLFAYMYFMEISHKDLYHSVTFRILCFFELLSMMVKLSYLFRVFIGMGKIVVLV
jgi:hypothetical protein